MFRIAEFARIAGVTAKTLRAWDEAGLFQPVWVDPVTRYRSYSPAQLPELRRILALRDLGVPLAELAELVRGGADLRAVLGRRRRQLEHDRRELDRRLRALDITLATAGRSPGRDGDAGPDVVIRPVAEERVATILVDASEAADLSAAFYELESYVRDHGRRASRPPGAIESIGLPGPSVAVFVPVSGSIAAGGRVRSGRLPACRAASIIHRGPYAGLPAAAEALRHWIRGAGHEPAGPLRVIYLQFGAEPELRVPRGYLVDRSADYVTELQQPIA